jgi:hypothetical protein
VLEKLLGRRKAYRVKKQAVKLPGRMLRSGGGGRVSVRHGSVRRPAAGQSVLVQAVGFALVGAGITVYVVAKFAIEVVKFVAATAANRANHARQAHKETSVSKFVWEPQVTADGFSCPLCGKACSEEGGFVACIGCMMATNATTLGNSVSVKPERVSKPLPVASDAEAFEAPSARKPRRTKAQKAQSRRGIALANLAKGREILAAKRAAQAVQAPVSTLVVRTAPVVARDADALREIRRANMAKAREALAAKRGNSVAMSSEQAQAACEANTLTPLARKILALIGDALPDGSFPISGPKSLARARKASFRAKNGDIVLAHITTRAIALGLATADDRNRAVVQATGMADSVDERIATSVVVPATSPLLALAARFRSEVAA